MNARTTILASMVGVVVLGVLWELAVRLGNVPPLSDVVAIELVESVYDDEQRVIWPG